MADNIPELNTAVNSFLPTLLQSPTYMNNLENNFVQALQSPQKYQSSPTNNVVDNLLLTSLNNSMTDPKVSQQYTQTLNNTISGIDQKQINNPFNLAVVNTMSSIIGSNNGINSNINSSTAGSISSINVSSNSSNMPSTSVLPPIESANSTLTSSNSSSNINSNNSVNSNASNLGPSSVTPSNTSSFNSSSSSAGNLRLGSDLLNSASINTTNSSSNMNSTASGTSNESTSTAIKLPNGTSIMMNNNFAHIVSSVGASNVSISSYLSISGGSVASAQSADSILGATSGPTYGSMSVQWAVFSNEMTKMFEEGKSELAANPSEWKGPLFKTSSNAASSTAASNVASTNSNASSTSTNSLAAFLRDISSLMRVSSQSANTSNATSDDSSTDSSANSVSGTTSGNNSTTSSLPSNALGNRMGSDSTNGSTSTSSAVGHGDGSLTRAHLEGTQVPLYVNNLTVKPVVKNGKTTYKFEINAKTRADLDTGKYGGKNVTGAGRHTQAISRSTVDKIFAANNIPKLTDDQLAKFASSNMPLANAKDNLTFNADIKPTADQSADIFDTKSIGSSNVPFDSNYENSVEAQKFPKAAKSKKSSAKSASHKSTKKTSKSTTKKSKAKTTHKSKATKSVTHKKAKKTSHDLEP